jgi:hypothetical protein
MIGEVIQCQYAGCEETFAKKTHNQRYHDDECCRLATNAMIMQKYYNKRAQRLGIARYCTECTKKLSRYNSDNICNACSVEAERQRNETTSNMLASISWAV